MTTKHTNNQPGQTEDFIRIQDLVYLCLSKWYWFALSLLLALTLAVAYILVTPSVYTRSATLLVKDDSKGKSLAKEMDAFADFGLFQSNSNVNNELIALQSPALMLEVIKRLRLDVNYHAAGTFHREVLYGSSLPVTLSVAAFPGNETFSLTLNLLEDGNVELSGFCRNDEAVGQGEAVTGRLRDSLVTPLGKITISPTPYYVAGETGTIEVSRSTLYETTLQYVQNLTVSLMDDKSTVINLSTKDVSTQRAEDLLNTLIAIYNENWVKDKNQIAVSTSMFINERLRVIEQELGSVEEDISSYKSEHLLSDLQTASNMYMNQSNEMQSQLLVLNNQLYMTRYIQTYLSTEANKNQLLPANAGIGNSNIESQIADYNTKQLQRNSLVANSSTQNPLVVDLDHSLLAIRQAIMVSVENQVVTLETQINTLQQNERQATARIAASPTQAQYLLSVERQQKVKEALYLFLLQKREENELSQAFTAYNTRIITPPSGEMKPTAPKKKNILLVAFVLGLLVPLVVLFVRENMNTTVRGRKDIENLTLPFIGEIPLFAPRNRNLLSRRKKPEGRSVVVEEGKRDVINEAFRVLRTNLEFMIGKENCSNVIVMTSFNPGSGKTFLAMNLAVSLAIKGKKVLLIDGDLRHGSTSAYIGSPVPGLSDYLAGRVGSVNTIISVDRQYTNLNIIPMGTIPPNPTELLFEDRLESLIVEMKQQYDYIFIDCPPIEIVADTQIIEKHADRTLFVVRAGLIGRDMLTELENIYREQKLKNMALILNGTGGEGRQQYRYGYGYHNSYGYAYHTNNE